MSDSTHNHSHDRPDHAHGHLHTHPEDETKRILNRLSRIIGHLESVKTMVKSERDCSEILIQLSAVRAAVNNTGKAILKSHIEHCIVDAVRDGDEGQLQALNEAIDRFIK